MTTKDPQQLRPRKTVFKTKKQPVAAGYPDQANDKINICYSESALSHKLPVSCRKWVK